MKVKVGRAAEGEISERDKHVRAKSVEGAQTIAASISLRKSDIKVALERCAMFIHNGRILADWRLCERSEHAKKKKFIMPLPSSIERALAPKLSAPGSEYVAPLSLRN